MSNVIPFQLRLRAIDPEAQFLACPKCESPAHWAVCVEGNDIITLICVSDECEGNYATPIDFWELP